MPQRRSPSQVVAPVDPVTANTATYGRQRLNPKGGLAQPRPDQPTTTQPIEEPTSAIPPPATAPTTWGQYTPEGYNTGKIAEGHDSPKYQIGQVLSNFDYRQGITPEVLNALNALGLGTFEQIGNDKVRVTGDVDPRFGGEKYTTIDLIRDAAGGGAAWQYLIPGQDGSAGQGITMPPIDMSSTLSAINQQISGGGGGGGIPPKPAPDWVWIGDGWVPPGHPLAVNAQPDPTQPTQSGGGGGSSTSRPFMGDELRDTILNLLDTGGAFNQGIIDMRRESLREGLEAQRNAEMQTLDAVLADRGLTGSGGDIQARQLLGERLGQTHATSLRDLVSEEAQRADERMMQALVTGAGMTIEEAQQAIDWFNAQTGRIGTEGNLREQAADRALRQMLGLGNLGLGQAQLEANYLLGQAGLGLDAEKLGLDYQNALLDSILRSYGIQGNTVPQY